MLRVLVVSLLVVGLFTIPAGAAFIVSAPDLTAEPDDYVNVPIGLVLDGLLEGLDVGITFDPNVLTKNAVNISKGSLLGSDWFLMVNYNFLDSGIVYVGMYTSGSGIQNPNGNLLNASFHVRPDAPLGLTVIGIVDYNDYGFTCDNGSIDVVPEPSTCGMWAGLLAVAAMLIWRRKSAAK